MSTEPTLSKGQRMVLEKYEAIVKNLSEEISQLQEHLEADKIEREMWKHYLATPNSSQSSHPTVYTPIEDAAIMKRERELVTKEHELNKMSSFLNYLQGNIRVRA